MKIIISTVFAVVLGLQSFSVFAFSDFKDESAQFEKLLKCTNGATIKRGSSKVFSCSAGKQDSVKFYVLEKNRSGKVKYIKFVWNEHTKDKGYGTAQDIEQAKAWLAVILKQYGGKRTEAIDKAFWGDSDVTKSTKKYKLLVSFNVKETFTQRRLVIRMK